MRIRRPQQRTLPLACLLVAVILLVPDRSFCQDTTKTIPDGTTGLVLKVGPQDYLTKKRPPNEFEGTYSTIRIGFGYILDAATYSQDAIFKQQMDSAGLAVNSKIETRDFRVMASGVFKTKRTLAWKTGFMYDGDKKIWYLRRNRAHQLECRNCLDIFLLVVQKEGYSMVKVMNGISLDCGKTDGARCYPYLSRWYKIFWLSAKIRLFWNLGYFNDFVSKTRAFQLMHGRLMQGLDGCLLTIKRKKRVLHVAANFRYGKTAGWKNYFKVATRI
jgi:phosphate-selective porin OprO/OprP